MSSGGHEWHGLYDLSFAGVEAPDTACCTVCGILRETYPRPRVWLLDRALNELLPVALMERGTGNMGVAQTAEELVRTAARLVDDLSFLPIDNEHEQIVDGLMRAKQKNLKTKPLRR